MLLAGGMLAGIGFTMSIFISTLAFDNLEFQDTGKIATLIASLIAAIFGCCFFIIANKKELIT